MLKPINYQLAAMGGDNFTKLKVTEAIGKERIKIIPEVLITGDGDGANGPISGLLGLKLMDDMTKKTIEENSKTAKKDDKKGDVI
jgi:hypothetical protein